MPAGYMLDTSVLIDHAAGEFGASELVEQLFGEPGDLYTCDAITAEVLSAGTDDERAVIERIVAALEYVATSPDAARFAADVRRSRGRTSRRHLGDAIIAGVAWSLDATVVTRNPRDFDGYGVPVLAYGG
jgi:predicted nucleic acid-binding protein